MNVFDLIERRRSRGRMTAEPPSRALIEKLLAAAVHAPNHHNTQPWRFFVLGGDARGQLGDVLAEALSHRIREGTDPSKVDALLAGERAKPLRSPVLIVVGVVPDRTNPITAREDFQATDAAIQNLLLAAEELGLAAIWRTGEGAFDDSVKAHFGLSPQDHIVGIVYLGYPDSTQPPLETRHRDFASVTEWRGDLPD